MRIWNSCCERYPSRILDMKTACLGHRMCPESEKKFTRISKDSSLSRGILC